MISSISFGLNHFKVCGSVGRFLSGHCVYPGCPRREHRPLLPVVAGVALTLLSAPPGHPLHCPAHSALTPLRLPSACETRSCLAAHLEPPSTFTEPLAIAARPSGFCSPVSSPLSAAPGHPCRCVQCPLWRQGPGLALAPSRRRDPVSASSAARALCRGCLVAESSSARAQCLLLGLHSWLFAQLQGVGTSDPMVRVLQGGDRFPGW